MHTIKLTKHEASILDWLLATPLGKKARGFTIVRKSGATSLEVTEVFDLLDLVTDNLLVPHPGRTRDLTRLGWKEPSARSLQSKVHAAYVKLGEQR